MEFKLHQRADLRWVYQLDGQDSETTYPTAGEAERGALGAMRAARANDKTMHWWMVWAAVIIPVAAVLWFVVQLILSYL